jgi:hypothetical protein
MKYGITGAINVMGITLQVRNIMASKHEYICAAVIADWTKNHKGRLYFMRQGKGRALNSEAVIDFGPIKGLKGFPDLFGFEFVDGIPVFCVVEVKTIGYSTLSKEQKTFLDYAASIGARSYIAREIKGGNYELHRVS